MKLAQNYWQKFIVYLLDKTAKNVVIFSIVILILQYRAVNKTYNFLKKSQWWTEKTILKYQLKKLRQLIKYSYENVPYYKGLFDKNGIKPEEITDLSNFKKIPFLTKDIIRQNKDELKSQSYPEYRFQYTVTSGSTGKPVGLYVDKINYYVDSFAFQKLKLERAGCNIFDKNIDIRGVVSIDSADKGKFWKNSIFGRSMSLSPYHINDDNIPKYIEKIRKFKPKYILSYPSIITEIARYMKKNNIKPISSLKVVFCTAEILYDWQKKLFTDVFRCRIFETYGLSENSALASYCEKSNLFHFFPEYGIVELIDKNSKDVTREDERGEIIVTGFRNDLFPFIRYKTGDTGVYTNQKCTCLRSCFLLKNIEGKWQQKSIFSKDNTPISFTSLDIDFKIFDKVKQFQFYQKEKGILILRILKKNDYTEEDTELILKEFYRLLKDNFRLKIEYVDNFNKTLTGKHSYLIQELPKSND
jgi:phenylacetate-CoA ligase